MTPEQNRARLAASDAAYNSKMHDCADALRKLQACAARGECGPLKSRPVEQDGRDFYFLDTGGDDTPEPMQSVKAPMGVPDFDMLAAANARHWFIMIWCARENVLPVFEEY